MHVLSNDKEYRSENEITEQVLEAYISNLKRVCKWLTWHQYRRYSIVNSDNITVGNEYRYCVTRFSA